MLDSGLRMSGSVVTSQHVNLERATPDPSKTPGMRAVTELRRFVDQQEQPFSLTDEMSLMVKALHLFLDEPAQADFTESVLSYIYNLLLEASKGAMKSADQMNLDRVASVKAAIQSCMQGAVPPKRLVSRFNSAASVAIQKRAGNHKVLRKLTRDQKECYICRQELGENEALRIDHVFPKRSGGSDDPRNLGRAHMYCEAPKGDSAHPSDAAISAFAFRKLPAMFGEPLNTAREWGLVGGVPQETIAADELAKIATKLKTVHLRLALLRRQRHTCYSENCSNPVGSLALAKRRDVNVPWGYTNVVYVCSVCSVKREVDGE